MSDYFYCPVHQGEILVCGEARRLELQIVTAELASVKSELYDRECMIKFLNDKIEIVESQLAKAQADSVLNLNEIKRLRDALNFYADKENYKEHWEPNAQMVRDCKIWEDNGKRATEALAAKSAGGGE